MRIHHKNHFSPIAHQRTRSCTRKLGRGAFLGSVFALASGCMAPLALTKKTRARSDVKQPGYKHLTVGLRNGFKPAPLLDEGGMYFFNQKMVIYFNSVTKTRWSFKPEKSPIRSVLETPKGDFLVLSEARNHSLIYVLNPKTGQVRHQFESAEILNSRAWTPAIFKTPANDLLFVTRSGFFSVREG